MSAIPPEAPGEEIAPSLTIHNQSPFGPREGWWLFDGHFYRGYAHGHWCNRKCEPRWIVEAWPRNFKGGFRRAYKTEAGAKAALIRVGRMFA